MATSKSLEMVFNEWTSINEKLWNGSKEIIMSILKKLPNSTIDISDNYPCSVVYDGGAHPEYNSNAFSCVESVYLKDGAIYLDIEDTSMYGINELSAYELYCIADAVIKTFNDEYEDADEEV